MVDTSPPPGAPSSEDSKREPRRLRSARWYDSPCHIHLRQPAKAVKRGVLLAAGYPVELPALSVGEVMVKPTTMLYRNFLALETEELLRSHLDRPGISHDPLHRHL
jgi:dihydroxyacid dehydratase/phosphogluconate dehydratase